MKKQLYLAGCIACLFLVGCASTVQHVSMPDQSKAVEDPAKGRIYVMRPSSFGAAVSMNITDNGAEIGSTGPGGYLCWEREPGDVILSSSSENTSRVSLPVRSGSIHFVRQNIRWGIWVARTDLEVLDETEGAKVLKKCKPAKIKTQ
jgi:hypothetical protein